MIRMSLFFFFIIFISCKPEKTEHVVTVSEKKSAELTTNSIYNLESEWITQDSQTVKLKDQLGKVQVLAMVYTSCPSVCPRLVFDMLEIDNQTREKYSDLRFTLVTMDPEVDTPEQLKLFAEEYQLDLSRWQLLQGKEDDILELAATLNVKFKKVSDTDYSHSILISVLNQNGEVVYRQEGMNANLNATLKAIEDCFKNH